MKKNIKTFLVSSISFGSIMGLMIGITSDFNNDLFSGILYGIIFGFIISVFTHIQKRNFKRIAPEIIGEKKIIYDGGANHFKGKESVGGWLYLTKDQLVFQSHKYNIQNHKLVIPLDQITKVNARQTLRLIPNGLQVDTIDSEEKFVVYNRNDWITKINLTKNEPSIVSHINKTNY